MTPFFVLAASVSQSPTVATTSEEGLFFSARTQKATPWHIHSCCLYFIGYKGVLLRTRSTPPYCRANKGGLLWLSLFAVCQSSLLNRYLSSFFFLCSSLDVFWAWLNLDFEAFYAYHLHTTSTIHIFVWKSDMSWKLARFCPTAIEAAAAGPSWHFSLLLRRFCVW